jgi:hypothetical protein
MKKIFVSILFQLFFFSVVSAQVFEEIEGEDKSEIKNGRSEGYIYIVPPAPEYKGGEKALFKFLQENLQTACMDSCGEVKIYVGFQVGETGKVSDISILRPVCKPCEEEVIRVIALMPDWIPAKENGIPINTRYMLPIIFNWK